MCYASACNLNFPLSDVYIIITQLDNTTACRMWQRSNRHVSDVLLFNVQFSKWKVHHMEKLLEE